MVIPASIMNAMVEHARAGFPNEACGLLAAEGDVATRWYPIENAEASPVFYKLESKQQLRAMLEIDDEGWELGAIVHSHTRTRAFPSPADISLATYPDSLYIIVSLADESSPDVRAFRIVGEQVQEQPIEIVA